MRRDRVWKRLRMLQVGAPSSKERLGRLTKKLLAMEALSTHERNEAASWLRQLAETPEALRLIEARQRGETTGRKADYQRQLDVALDYWIQRSRRKSSDDAATEVSRAWALSPGTVKDYFTDNRSYAEIELERLLSGAMSPTRVPDPLTKAQALELLTLDLRDIGKAERSRRKKSG